MLTQQTLDKMNAMKLIGHGRGPAAAARLGRVRATQLRRTARAPGRRRVDRPRAAQAHQRLRAAKLRYPASLEDVDFKHPRGLDRQQVLSLGNCGFIQQRHNLLIIGPTGIGKSYLACAFVERACRRGYTAAYVRLPRLLQRARRRPRRRILRPHPRPPGQARPARPSTTGCSPPCATASDATCSRSSRIAASAPPRSSPASSRSRTGTPASAIPTWPTPSATACSTTPTASSSRDHRCDAPSQTPRHPPPRTKGMTDASSLRSDGPVDAAGLWKAVDGYEVRQERIRPPLPTSPWKTGIRTPVSHSAHRPPSSGSQSRRRICAIPAP